jgi:ferredoxin
VWRIRVENSCVAITPHHFTLADDHRSQPTATEIAPDNLVLDAVASCPMQAIKVEDAVTGKAIDP